MLPELFKSDDRVRILRYVSLQKIVTVQSASAGTGVSKPVVSRYLNFLVRNELCKQEKRSISWKETPLGTAAKKLLNIEFLDKNLTLPRWALGVGIYGSWARGTNILGSDIDLWIFVKKYSAPLEMKIATFQHELTRKTGSEVNILLLTREKLQDLSSRDLPFYREFMRDQVLLRGKGIDEA